LKNIFIKINGIYFYLEKINGNRKQKQKKKNHYIYISLYFILENIKVIINQETFVKEYLPIPKRNIEFSQTIEII